MTSEHGTRDGSAGRRTRSSAGRSGRSRARAAVSEPERRDPAGAEDREPEAEQHASLETLSADPLHLDAIELARLCAVAVGLGASELERVRALLERTDLALAARMDPLALASEAGIELAHARRLAAAFALGRRVETARWLRGDSLRTADGVHRLMAPRVRGLERETLYVLLLDGKHRLKSCQRVSEGTLTSSLVHPREVFAPAVRAAAAAVIAVHNHPSGDPEPSAEDVAVTRRLADAGKLLGVPLLDHVVVAQGGYVSLRERLGL